MSAAVIAKAFGWPRAALHSGVRRAAADPAGTVRGPTNSITNCNLGRGPERLWIGIAMGCRATTGSGCRSSPNTSEMVGMVKCYLWREQGCGQVLRLVPWRRRAANRYIRVPGAYGDSSANL